MVKYTRWVPPPGRPPRRREDLARPPRARRACWAARAPSARGSRSAVAGRAAHQSPLEALRASARARRERREGAGAARGVRLPPRGSDSGAVCMYVTTGCGCISAARFHRKWSPNTLRPEGGPNSRVSVCVVSGLVDGKRKEDLSPSRLTQAARDSWGEFQLNLQLQRGNEPPRAGQNAA
eukprot:scaffold9821_cov61-Phaeocystis_antarctica.AAC.6